MAVSDPDAAIDATAFSVAKSDDDNVTAPDGVDASAPSALGTADTVASAPIAAVMLLPANSAAATVADPEMFAATTETNIPVADTAAASTETLAGPPIE